MKTYNIAIIGAGPSGYFTAQAFQNQESKDLIFNVDLFERLPTPWGLVRSGVAPDHQKIKDISKVFEKIAEHKNFRLFANINVGIDIELSQLQEEYDAVVLATGASDGKRLNIPGEQLKNVFSSAEFVPWYNAHPEFGNLEVDLNIKRAVIIGGGNVALDVARVLLKDPKMLATTDINIRSQTLLENSKIREVVICTRRGPEHSSFTSLELRNLINLPNIQVKFDKKEIRSAMKRINRNTNDLDIRKKIEIMNGVAKLDTVSNEKLLSFRFLHEPINFVGIKKVTGVQFSIKEIKNESISSLNMTKTINCGMVITAIGYEPNPLKSVEVINGKLINSQGKIIGNLFCVGWAKRGSTGVIGTNKKDAQIVVESILKSLTKPKRSSAISKSFFRNIDYVSQRGWQKINERELTRGRELGKVRFKETSKRLLINWSKSNDPLDRNY